MYSYTHAFTRLSGEGVSRIYNSFTNILVKRQFPYYLHFQKIIQKWVHMKLMSYLNHHQLLNQKQSGFRSGHEIESALLPMPDTWLQAINDGDIVCCVLVDFHKAFNLVEHKLLLQKLKHFKIIKLSLSWFDSYLSHRTQQVNINTNQSKTGSVLYGAQQGSILGPLLFLICINTLPLFIVDSIRSSIYMLMIQHCMILV